jgi:glycosyltransferase involved in cell wall biosynthesis
MLQDQNIVCFANDWDSDPLSKKHVMTRLAERNRVLWVDSLGVRNPQVSARDARRVVTKLARFLRGRRRVQEGLWVISPLVLPFHGSSFARRLNQKWLRATLRLACRRLGMRDPIVWTFLPTSADVAGSLDARLLVYHCVDEYSQFTGTDAVAIATMERDLCRRADLVVVSAEPLLRAKSRHNPDTFLVTHGVEIEHFRQALDPALCVPSDLPSDDGPVVGFFGLLADWVDLELVRYLAKARPAWNLVLIGKADTSLSAVQGLPNVRILGRKSYSELPAYCKGFDAAILPFRINELTLAANPLKLREYLAAGLPVVATAIPEAERLAPLVRVGRDREQFLWHLDSVLSSGAHGPRREISAAMQNESWDRKVEELSDLASRFLSARRDETPGDRLERGVS